MNTVSTEKKWCKECVFLLFEHTQAWAAFVGVDGPNNMWGISTYIYFFDILF